MLIFPFIQTVVVILSMYVFLNTKDHIAGANLSKYVSFEYNIIIKRWSGKGYPYLMTSA